MKVLSFGAGVNSSAILVLHARNIYHVDAVVFADTKCEHPQTYEFIKEVVIPFCHQISLPFHIVSHGNLLEDYSEKQIIPFRRFRSCTDKYKIRPIKKFVEEQYGKDVTYVLGIDYGEQRRIKRYQCANFEFPLINLKINREQCKTLIKSFDWEVPIKSGCFFCPFTPKKGWITLLKGDRELYLQAEHFEKNGRAYPKYSLTNKPLEDIRKAIENQKSLCNWLDVDGDPCVFCHA